MHVLVSVGSSVHEVYGGGCGDGLVPVAADELARSDAEDGRCGSRGGED